MRHALHAEICQLSSRGQTRRGTRLYEGLQFPASNNPALDSPKTMRPVLITTIQKLFLLCCVLIVSSLLAESLPPIAINDNHKPSGILRDGVLTIQLEIAKGEWHPEADDGIALAVYAFGEAGRPLQNPGPLIRVDTQPGNKGDEPGLIGPPIILTRAEPVEIEVVNRLKEQTAIHWHGIELESYYDGVPGWSGVGNQITPSIEPGTSFVARMTPPRAGTFIYHTHWHDPSQLTNGIYGPLIVLPPGQKFDPASDLTFVFSIGDFGALHELALINGTPQSKTLQLQAGKKYRIRLINISTNNQGMQVSLRDANGPVEWLNIAKDGIDLIPHPGKAQLTITVGETYDVEFSTARPQDLLLDLLLPAQKIHTTQTLTFTAASSTSQ